MSVHFTPSSEVEFLKMKRRLCGHLMGPNSYSGHGREYENRNVSIRNLDGQEKLMKGVFLGMSFDKLPF